MIASREVVLTGIGVVSPIGIGRTAYWDSMIAGRSGVRSLPEYDNDQFPVRIAGKVLDFDAKLYVTPRKSLKVMSREIQWAFAAARQACEESGLKPGTVDPERFGVVFGADLIYIEPDELITAYRSCLVNGKFDFSLWGSRALGEMFPLWLLKFLPNMPACHIGIAHDARGPNNSITLGDVSSLVAMTESFRLLERGAADIMVTGGTGYRSNSMTWGFRVPEFNSRRFEDPAGACRPFDADRDGPVWGDGAAAMILETRSHAEARRAPVLARVLGFANACETPSSSGLSGSAIARVIRRALDSAGVSAADIGHVNAHGMSTVSHDRLEAQAIRDLFGDVPVTAPKSFFGNLGAGAGAVEAIASVLALEKGQIPFTRNYQRPDPKCPLNVVRRQPAPLGRSSALLLNFNTTGQASAVVLAGPNF